MLTSDDREAQRLRVPTPQGDYPATLKAVTDLVRRLDAQAGQACTVGVGIPGTVSPATGLVKNAHGDSSGVRGAAWLWD